MKTGRDWDGSCCWGARKSFRRGGSTTRLKHCCALATVNCKQCPLQPVRSSRSASNEQGVGVAFRYNRPLYLVTFPYPPRRLESDARWRAGVRLTLGPLRPLLSMAPRPPFHRTRTVVGAAARARLDKDGSPWRRSPLVSTYRRTASMLPCVQVVKILPPRALVPGSTTSLRVSRF